MRTYEEVSAELAVWREKRAECDLVVASVSNKVIKSRRRLAKAEAAVAELKEQSYYYFSGVTKTQLKNAQEAVTKAEKRLAAALAEREKVAVISKRVSEKFKKLKQIARKVGEKTTKREFEAQQKTLKKEARDEKITQRAAVRAARISKKEAARRQAVANREARAERRAAREAERLAKREARAQRARLNREAWEAYKEERRATRAAELDAARALREEKRAKERAEKEERREHEKSFYEAHREIRVFARTRGSYSDILKLSTLKKNTRVAKSWGGNESATFKPTSLGFKGGKMTSVLGVAVFFAVFCGGLVWFLVEANKGDEND